MAPQRGGNRNVSLGAYHVPRGVIPGAMNSPLAGLAVSLGGVGSTHLSSWVCQSVHLVSNPLFLMIATFQYYALFCFMAPNFFLLGIFR